MPAPTFIASYQTTYNTIGPSKTVLVTTLPGDLVLMFATQRAEGGFFMPGSTNGISFTQFAGHEPAFGEAGADGWYGVDSTGGTNWTLELQYSEFIDWGFTCYVFRGSAGAGAYGISHGLGQYDTAVTTTGANSAVAVYRAEAFGSGSEDDWLTVNSITPTVGNSLERVSDSTGNDLTSSAYYNDVGTTGLKTFGIVDNSSSNYAVVIAIEVLGSAPAAPVSVAWWGA